MRITNHANLSPEQLALIEYELREHRALSDVVKWGLKQPPESVAPQIVASVIVQDEYTHDALVPWRDGLVIVYGIT